MSKKGKTTRWVAAYGPGYSPCGHRHLLKSRAWDCAERRAIPLRGGGPIGFHPMTEEEHDGEQLD